MKGRHRHVYVPSPDELRERCRAIQNEWTTTERRKRSVVRSHHWTPPTVRMAELGFAHDTMPASRF